MNNQKDFIHYKDFFTKDQLKTFEDILKENEIDYKVLTNEGIIDEFIVGTQLSPKYNVHISFEDFDTVNKILLEHPISEEEIEGHYLNQLDDNELIDVLKEPEEWSIEAIQTAGFILKYRKVDIPYQQIEDLEKERILIKQNGKKEPLAMLLTYAFCIVGGFYISIILIVAGFGMGFYYSYGRKTYPDGKKYYVYNKQTRSYGKFIFYGGLVAFLVQIYLLFLR